ncbi:hypothetical protein [Halalkalibacter alkaliphilus]|uniref:DUF3784 domain-containing protein n=1 Tax=Halalkalibacter alkaliphilus TaxID=2917993 RepID=A0A9X2CV25_9BACI|nr:hypothetical protein [Halalkalibacter alkaliphilus]MCL7748797.1 hypothetical protein [Halalkalibacter alkaliphilus]
MALSIILIIIGILFFVVAYFIGIKKNLNFISFFMLGFTERLVADKDKDKVVRFFGILSLIVATYFLVSGITRLL